MATITVRQVDEDVKAKLRIRAARHGNSMEAEVRNILEQAVSVPEPKPGKGFGTRTHELFAGLDWDGSTLPSRDEPDRPIDFDE